MTPKRVLLLITNFGQGGAERVFYDHACAFKEFYAVEEVVFDRCQNQRIYDSDLPLHDLRRNDFLFKMGSIGRLLSRARALRKLVSDGRFDVVISHMDGANWVNVLSGSVARKVLVVHGPVLNDGAVPRFRQWVRRHVIFPFLYNRAEQTITVSEGIAREITTTCGVRNAKAIPNFFDVAAIRSKAACDLAEPDAAVFNHPGVLVTAGRLAVQKNQASLINLMAKLKQRGVNARLLILGDGPLREALLDHCRTLKLRTLDVWDRQSVRCADFDVYFAGYVSNPFQYVARSALFLFPSNWEGFPLALCEAMICGAPVLSADCPTGPREILAPGTTRPPERLRNAEFAENGVLLPMVQTPEDLETWTDTVEKLLLDQALRRKIGECAAQAAEALDRRVIVPQWYALIDSFCYQSGDKNVERDLSCKK